jgi:hypothetical protein
VGASEFLEALLIELAILPKLVHLVIHLLSIEGGELLAELLETDGGLDVRNEVEHMDLGWAESNCFHIVTVLSFYANKGSYYLSYHQIISQEIEKRVKKYGNVWRLIKLCYY